MRCCMAGKESPGIAKEFVEDYIRERIKAARHVFNDPDEVEKIVDLLEAAEKRAQS